MGHDLAEIEYARKRIRDFYQNHYLAVALKQQTGGVLPGIYVPYRVRSDQTGDGFGSIFRGLFRAILPVLKSGGKALARQGLSATSNVVGDLIRGKNFKETLSNRFDESGEQLVEKLKNKVDRMMTGSGRRRRITNKRGRSGRALLSLKSNLTKCRTDLASCRKGKRGTPKRRRKTAAAKRGSTTRRRRRRTTTKGKRRRRRKTPVKRLNAGRKRKSTRKPAKQRRRRRRQKSSQVGSGFDFWL